LSRLGPALRALIQRVDFARIYIDSRMHGEINQGILALIGIEKPDNVEQADALVQKILSYRIFSDADGKMNLSLKNIGGGLMLVSQFTLAADTNKGLRPSFSSAMPPDEAAQLFQYTVDAATKDYPQVVSGVFAADMKIELLNNGPVTFLLEN